MFGGLYGRWKQVVAYYFTPNSYDGALLKPILLTIIEKAETIGLKVHSVTSDMGPINRVMWNAFQIGVSRYSTIQNSIPHPQDTTRRLFFLADAPHLLKNLKNSLLSNKVITLPENFRTLYNLEFPTVECEHLNDLLQLQENVELKLTPKININDLNCNTFGKMKVNKARNMFSSDVSSALKFLAKEKSKTEYMSTAWFINMAWKWFTVVTARSPKVALGIMEDETSLEKYNDTVLFLENIIDLFRHIHIGIGDKSKGTNTGKLHFKPVQAGILITTKSVIELSDYLLTEREYQFVLTGRLTQDCVENLFSCIRAKHVVPNAIQFKYNLKLIVVSQFFKCLSNSNYNEDDRKMIGSFLDRKQKPNTQLHCESSLPLSEINVSQVTLDNIALNILYNIAGYIVSNIAKTAAVCNRCIRSAGSKTSLPNIKYSTLVQLKCYAKNTLFYINQETFLLFVEMEQIIRAYLPTMQHVNIRLKSMFIQKMTHITCNTLYNCHNLLFKIKCRFIVYRLKIAINKSRNNIKIYGSKSMAMHTFIK